MTDQQYQGLSPKAALCIIMASGHLLSYPYAMSMLERLSSPTPCSPRPIISWVRCIASSSERSPIVSWPQALLFAHENGGVHRRRRLRRGHDRSQRVVVVDVARAGIIPAHHFYEGLHAEIDAPSHRQDHVVASRTTDGAGKVTGVTRDGSKIGGPIDDATVIFPDPMGATGSILAGVI